jgi:hypothetical protein
MTTSSLCTPYKLEGFAGVEDGVGVSLAHERIHLSHMATLFVEETE